MKEHFVGAIWALALVTLGFVGARVWFPRIEMIQVDREIVRTVERLVPGQSTIVYRDVQGPTQLIRIPIEVTRVVEKLGPERVVERIVTITKPVEVSVEVVKKEWPQVITVTVGGVQSGGTWYAPDNPELVVGQVTPGVYAVPVQAGWRIESVKTVTRLEPVRLPPLMQRGFTVGARVDLRQDRQSVSGDVVYRNLAGPGEYAVRFPLSTVGAAPSVQLTYDLRW